MYANANAALLNQYRNDSVMTAGPVELIIMLYDGLIKNIKLASIFIGDKRYDKANMHLVKAQDIVLELMRILDLKYEISEQLLKLYDFMLDALRNINAQKNTDSVPALLDIISDLRSAWQVLQSNGNHQFQMMEE